MADLLNNFLYQKNQQNKSASLPFVKLDLNTENKVKPLDGRGHMLPSRILGSPIEYVKDLKKDVVSIKKGVQGKANDHELGRMNDLATKIGALGLAGYLIAKNPLKLKKSMELVGVASFFGTMALWPKLAIQAPLKKKFGVDIHQKYEDSYGRKKSFFQDPQYLPWDLVSKEDLNKMGDKLKIPTDIENRDEVIKQKAQKISVQGNTLWMMTAGFATPIFSALACNVAEKGIGKFQGEMAQRASKKVFDASINAMKNSETAPIDLSQYSVKNAEAKKAFNAIFSNADGRLDANAINKITDAVNIDSSLQFSDAIAKELKLMSKPTGEVDDEFITNLFKKNETLFSAKGVTKQQVAEILNADEVKQAIKNGEMNSTVDKLVALVDTEKGKVDSAEVAENLKKLFFPAPKRRLASRKVTNTPAWAEVLNSTKPVREEGAAKAAKLMDAESIARFYGENVRVLDGFGITEDALKSAILGDKKAVEVTTENVGTVVENIAKTANRMNGAQIFEYKKSIGQSLVDTVNATTPKLSSVKGRVEDMLKTIDNFVENKKIIKSFVDSNVGNKAETFIANQWAEVNKAFMESLNFDEKELAIVRRGSEGASQIIEQHIADLAKPENADNYSRAMKKISAAVAKYNDVLSSNNVQKPTNEAIEKIFGSAAKDFRANGFEELAKFIDAGSDGFAPGSYKKVMQSYVEGRVRGAQACFYRMIQTMDLYKRIEDGTLAKQFEHIKNPSAESIQTKELFKQVENALSEVMSPLHPGKSQWIKTCINNKTPGDFAVEFKNQLADHANTLKNTMNGNLTKIITDINNNNFTEKSFEKLLDGNDDFKKLVPGLSQDLLSKIKAGVNSLSKGEMTADQVKALINSEVDSSVDSLSKRILDVIQNSYIPAKVSYEKLAFDIADEYRQFQGVAGFDEIVKKAKATLLSYKIKDHTEKLNDVGAQTYKVIMGLLYKMPIADETKAALGSKVSNGLDSYKNLFVDKVANWQYWYKPDFVLSQATTDMDGSLRHALVGSSVDDMVSNAASGMFNTNKWLKTFGLAAIALTGVTLAAGKFFGKMKKEDVYAGEQK